MRKVGIAGAIAAGAAIVASATGLAGNSLRQISSDPFTNAPAIDGVPVYHMSEEEPDTFAFGSTVVSAFQVGRFQNAVRPISVGRPQRTAGRTGRTGSCRD